MSNQNEIPGSGQNVNQDHRSLETFLAPFHFIRWLFTSEIGRAIFAGFIIFTLVAGLVGMMIGPSKRDQHGRSNTIPADHRPLIPSRGIDGTGDLQQHGLRNNDTLDIPRGGATGGCITINGVTECHWYRAHQ